MFFEGDFSAGEEENPDDEEINESVDITNVEDTEMSDGKE